jgi:archaellum component FlaC
MPLTEEQSTEINNFFRSLRLNPYEFLDDFSDADCVNVYEKLPVLKSYIRKNNLRAPAADDRYNTMLFFTSLKCIVIDNKRKKLINSFEFESTQDYLEYIASHEAVYQSFHEFIEILIYTPDAYKTKFAENNIYRFQGFADLIAVAKLLPAEDRISFINQCSYLFQSSRELSAVRKELSLDADEVYKFAKENAHLMIHNHPAMILHKGSSCDVIFQELINSADLLTAKQLDKIFTHFIAAGYSPQKMLEISNSLIAQGYAKDIFSLLRDTSEKAWFYIIFYYAVTIFKDEIFCGMYENFEYSRYQRRNDEGTLSNYKRVSNNEELLKWTYSVIESSLGLNNARMFLYKSLQAYKTADDFIEFLHVLGDKDELIILSVLQVAASNLNKIEIKKFKNIFYFGKNALAVKLLPNVFNSNQFKFMEAEQELKDVNEAKVKLQAKVAEYQQFLETHDDDGEMSEDIKNKFNEMENEKEAIGAEWWAIANKIEALETQIAKIKKKLDKEKDVDDTYKLVFEDWKQNTQIKLEEKEKKLKEVIEVKEEFTRQFESYAKEVENKVLSDGIKKKEQEIIELNLEIKAIKKQLEKNKEYRSLNSIILKKYQKFNDPARGGFGNFGEIIFDETSTEINQDFDKIATLCRNSVAACRREPKLGTIWTDEACIDMLIKRWCFLGNKNMLNLIAICPKDIARVLLNNRAVQNYLVRRLTDVVATIFSNEKPCGPALLEKMSLILQSDVFRKYITSYCYTVEIPEELPLKDNVLYQIFQSITAQGHYSLFKKLSEYPDVQIAINRNVLLKTEMPQLEEAFAPAIVAKGLGAGHGNTQHTTFISERRREKMPGYELPGSSNIKRI